jgi:hypothetical protein
MLLRLPVLNGTAMVSQLEKHLVGKVLFHVATLRYLAIFNWMLVGLILIEYVFKEYIYGNDIQQWCEKSIFGIGKDKFNNLEQEEKAFGESILSI